VPSYAIITVLYPAALSFVGQWAAGVVDNIAAAAEAPFKIEPGVIVLCDGIAEGHASLDALSRRADVQFLSATDTPARLRLQLLRRAASLGFERLICSDIDDRLRPRALLAHAEALDAGDFSYGDHVLIDEHGKPLGHELFDNWDVPSRLRQPEALLLGNFVGFGALGLQTDIVNKLPEAVPQNIGAFDWWAATRLLKSGCTGVRTRIPVNSYRLHGNNLLGARQPSDERSWQAEVGLAVAHFQAFADDPRYADYVGLLQQLSREPFSAREQPAVQFRAPWFSEVMQAATKLRQTTRATSI
jgi:hypothetical protein